MVLLFLSTGEIFFVGLVIVMLFGAKKIPEIARGLGKGIREFKNATSDIQEEIRKSSAEIGKEADLNRKEDKPSAGKSSTNKESKE